MGSDFVSRAQRGDLTGMNFAAQVRLSDESKRRKREKQQKASGKTPQRARTGMDINNRDEQVADCVKYVESRGGKIVYLYEEPHTSAWKRRRIVTDDGSVIFRVIRPVYAGMIEDLKRGVAPNGERLDGVICPDLDRLTRDNRDLEDSIDAVVNFHRPILDLSGALDLSTEMGRSNARVVVAFKSAQSADAARRVKRKHEALQREGIPTGGARPFGWSDDKRTLHPIEAPLLKQAVKDILTGLSMTALVADWTERGIITPQGSTWTISTLKTALRNPRMAGYRMKTVEIKNDGDKAPSRRTITTRDEDGNPVLGQWEPMITPEEWERLTAIIGEAPSRGDAQNTRKYLGTGTLRCGKEGCDSKLRAMKTTPKEGYPEGHFRYGCPSKSQGGCGGVKIDGPATDKVLIRLAIAKYEVETATRQATAEPTPWLRQAELDRVLENKAAAKAARDAGTISAELYYADLGECEAKERALIKDRNAHLKATAQAAELPVNLRDDWLEGRLTLSAQRTYIERAFSAVIVAPAGGRKVPARDRLTPIPAS